MSEMACLHELARCLAASKGFSMLTQSEEGKPQRGAGNFVSPALQGRHASPAAPSLQNGGSGDRHGHWVATVAAFVPAE